MLINFYLLVLLISFVVSHEVFQTSMENSVKVLLILCFFRILR